MIFCPWKHEKMAHKNCSWSAPNFFFSVLARLPKRPKNRNPVPPNAPYCRNGYLDWAIIKDFTPLLLLHLCLLSVNHLSFFFYSVTTKCYNSTLDKTKSRGTHFCLATTFVKNSSFFVKLKRKRKIGEHLMDNFPPNFFTKWAKCNWGWLLYATAWPQTKSWNSLSLSLTKAPWKWLQKTSI